MPSDKPIFVVGAPRSGTSLVQSILDAHPHIVGPEWESGLFVALDLFFNGDLVKFLQVRPKFPLTRSDLVEWARDGVARLFERLAEAAGKQRWSEKTPAHVLHMKLIVEVFPGAQFIHIIRDGREVVRSLQNQPWTPNGIRWSVRTWMEYVRAGRDAGRELPQSQYHEVRYEHLTANPETVVHGLCEYLGEPFDPATLEYYKLDRNALRSDAVAVQKKPLNRYKEPSLLERLVFRRMAGSLMRELDYR